MWSKVSCLRTQHDGRDQARTTGLQVERLMHSILDHHASTTLSELKRDITEVFPRNIEMRILYPFFKDAGKSLRNLASVFQVAIDPFLSWSSAANDLRLVFTGDGIGVGVEVVRALPT